MSNIITFETFSDNIADSKTSLLLSNFTNVSLQTGKQMSEDITSVAVFFFSFLFFMGGGGRKKCFKLNIWNLLYFRALYLVYSNSQNISSTPFNNKKKQRYNTLLLLFQQFF